MSFKHVFCEKLVSPYYSRRFMMSEPEHPFQLVFLVLSSFLFIEILAIAFSSVIMNVRGIEIKSVKPNRQYTESALNKWKAFDLFQTC